MKNKLRKYQKIVLVFFALICMLLFVIYFPYYSYRWRFQKELKELKVIGENTWSFDIIVSHWSELKSYFEFHKSIANEKMEYLLLESGATNGISHDYYLVDMNKNQIKANFLKINGVFKIKENFIKDFEEYLRNMRPEPFFDATSGDLDSGVYFLTYQNENDVIKYGFYSWSNNFNQYGNARIEKIARKNKVIYYKLINYIEKEIYRQKPELFKERPLFYTYFED